MAGPPGRIPEQGNLFLLLNGRLAVSSSSLGRGVGPPLHPPFRLAPIENGWALYLTFVKECSAVNGMTSNGWLLLVTDSLMFTSS